MTGFWTPVFAGMIPREWLCRVCMDVMPPKAWRAIVKEDPETGREIMKLEDEVDELRRKLSDQHIENMKSQTTCYESGIIFIDIIHNLEKIADHLKNISQTACNFFDYLRGKAKLSE